MLDELSTEATWSDRVAAQRAGVLQTYESIFDHHAFTGRSGGMYGYEGIGCTYWHMVAKLLVAVGECALAAEADGASPETTRRLTEGYRRVRDGLGFRMDAATFGALPIDAYSHSNGDGQARQPGMTGQVKEELLTRRMELGVQPIDGGLRFAPTLLEPREWLERSTTWRLPTHAGHAAAELELPADGLGFQICGVPVVYRRGADAARILVHDGHGEVSIVEGDHLDRTTTARLRAHDGSIGRIEVELTV